MSDSLVSNLGQWPAQRDQRIELGDDLEATVLVAPSSASSSQERVTSPPSRCAASDGRRAPGTVRSAGRVTRCCRAAPSG